MRSVALPLKRVIPRAKARTHAAKPLYKRSDQIVHSHFVANVLKKSFQNLKIFSLTFYESKKNSHPIVFEAWTAYRTII